jgi:hypothetical protein
MDKTHFKRMDEGSDADFAAFRIRDNQLKSLDLCKK